jgi:hypothetical protein
MQLFSLITNKKRSRLWLDNIRHRIVMLSALRLFFTLLKVSPMTSLPRAWTSRARSSASGESVSLSSGWRASKSSPEAGGLPAFPPSVIVEVKALACELPSRLGLPLSRFSVSDIRTEVLAQGIVAQISGSTLWRWLSSDAIRPWCHRSWIFPRDPEFVKKAAPVLDLYEGLWRGRPLSANEFVLSADEKTSIQARIRKHRTLPPSESRPAYVEHEYQRGGALNYLAAWDVHRARIIGRCEPKTGIASFDRLVEQVMSQQPYRSADRVFWVVDNCSSHRGQKASDRLRANWPNTVLIHLPVHASWLNQIEIYFSILQRKVLTPNAFTSLAELEQLILGFQSRYNQIASPFRWTFTRKNLADLMNKLGSSTRLKAA